MKEVTILGSTGSIGISTLDVLSRHPAHYKATALTAYHQVDRLYEQCIAHQPEFAVMVDEQAAEQLSNRLRARGGLDVQVLAGVSGLEQVASLPQVDYVMAAIVGAAGLQPTLAAANAGKHILLANKESLVMSGRLFLDAVSNNNALLLPIDSEHNAIFQCLPETKAATLETMGVVQILLTASGGPFRDRSFSDLDNVTPSEACAHPNWQMGRKISVDSATMMNKGLEVIEARWLFNARADQIKVVLHPQSIIHSLVSYEDGSVLAQLGNPDMRTPIAHALAWPQRMASGVAALDLVALGKLEFRSAEFSQYPCLRFAYDALAQGGTCTTTLNAANEIAVDAFLNETIRFTDIPKVIESVLEVEKVEDVVSLDQILACDAQARRTAQESIRRLESSYS